jgi:ABC-type lipoprotein export system ATPase subunit
MEEPIISAEKLRKFYKRGRLFDVGIDLVDLAVSRGEFVSVMGPSGSGKTTLLNLIGALDKPSAGKVILDKIDLSTIPERKLYKVRRDKVGFIFQTFYLVPTLSVLDNVLLPTLPVGRKKYKERAENLLNLVGLAGMENKTPNFLSSGEQQRVAIARSLIMNPPIILADEPTGNLDSQTGSDIFHLLRDLAKNEGKTVLIVTHDPRIAKGTGRIIFLKDGRISEHPSVELNITF